MIQEHFAGVRTLIVAEVPVAVQVVDSVLTSSTGDLVRATYVVLFGGGPDSLDDDRLTAPQVADSDAEYGYTARCVSVTADGARTLAGRVFMAVGNVPVVAGRNCGPLGFDASNPLQVDNNAKPPLFYIDVELSLTSSRA